MKAEKAREFKSRSELPLVYQRKPGYRGASIYFTARAGAINEPYEKRGISHFLEHMVFNGTPSYPEPDLIMEDVGAHWNAFTWKNYTTYYAKFQKEHLPLVSSVFSEMLTCPNFNKISREKEIVLEEMMTSKDDPYVVSFDHLFHSAFPEQPLGQSIIGEKSTVRSITRADLSNYLKQYYVASNMSITLLGDFSAKEIEHLLDSDPFPKGKRAKKVRINLEPKENFSFLRKDYQQYHLHFFTEGSSLEASPQELTTNSLLRGVLNLRLEKELQKDRGLVTSLYVRNAPFEGFGMFEIYLSLEKKNINKVVEIILNHLENLASHGPGSKELGRVKEITKTRYVLWHDQEESRSDTLIPISLFRLPILSLADQLRIIEEREKEDLTSLAQKLFKEIPFLAATGPEQSSLKKSLPKFFQ